MNLSRYTALLLIFFSATAIAENWYIIHQVSGACMQMEEMYEGTGIPGISEPKDLAIILRREMPKQTMIRTEYNEGKTRAIVIFAPIGSANLALGKGECEKLAKELAEKSDNESTSVKGSSDVDSVSGASE